MAITGTIIKFASGIFTKSRYAQWKGRGWKRYVFNFNEKIKQYPKHGQYYPGSVFIVIQKGYFGSAQSKKNATKWIMNHVINWNKDMQKNISDHLASCKVLPSPPPKLPPEVHKVSASYKLEAKTQTTTEPRLFQAGISKIPKIPLYALIGAGALFLIFNLTKTKGGAV